MQNNYDRRGMYHEGPIRRTMLQHAIAAIKCYEDAHDTTAVARRFPTSTPSPPPFVCLLTNPMLCLHSSGVYVEGLTSIAVSGWEEMSQLLMYGGGARTVAATNANDWSSRSHAVFTLTLRQVLVAKKKKLRVVHGSQLHAEKSPIG